MEEERPSNDAEDLSNVLKKAKESDRAKGRAVARQMVSQTKRGWLTQTNVDIGHLGCFNRFPYPITKSVFALQYAPFRKLIHSSNRTLILFRFLPCAILPATKGLKDRLPLFLERLYFFQMIFLSCERYSPHPHP